MWKSTSREVRNRHRHAIEGVRTRCKFDFHTGARRRRSATTRASRPNSTAETRRLWSSLRLSCCRRSPSANCRRSTPSSRKREAPARAASASRSWRPPGRSRERSDGSSSSSSSARAPTRSPRGRTRARIYARSSNWSRRARPWSCARCPPRGRLGAAYEVLGGCTNWRFSRPRCATDERERDPGSGVIMRQARRRRRAHGGPRPDAAEAKKQNFRGVTGRPSATGAASCRAAAS